MEKKIISIGNLKGTHGGWKVYSWEGICPTLTSTDYKHNKMVLLWKRK